jgi:hypothetical protein
MEQMIKRPGRSSQQYKVYRGLEHLYEQQKKELEEKGQYIEWQDLPDNARRGMMPRMAKQPFAAEGANGTVFLWNPGWTTTDLNQLNLGNFELLGQISPLVKTPIEVARKKKLGAEFEPSLEGMTDVTPTMAALATKLGLDVVTATDEDTGETVFKASPMVPYAVNLAVPDIDSLLQLAPDLAAPESEIPVPLSSAQATSAVTKLRAHIPGASGLSKRVKVMQAASAMDKQKGLRSTMPPKGETWQKLPQSTGVKLPFLRDLAKAVGVTPGVKPTQD